MTRIKSTITTATLPAFTARLGNARNQSPTQNWRRGTMKMVPALLLVLCTVKIALGGDVAFHDVKVADARGKQADGSLLFNESNKTMVVRVADRDFLTIPYDKIDKLSYEYSKKHRITEGAIVMVASLGAGAVVMLTQSKSHWLYTYYRQDTGTSTLVLRMDKKNYKKILDAATAQTGKQVEFLGNAKRNK
jgi:hypothetical protein